MLPANYTPNDAEVQKYLDAWDNLDDCVSHEVALTLLFSTYPNNTEVSEVLIKCLVLNDFYSAGVRSIDIQKMAEHIVSCNIDNGLKNGDWSVVDKISKCGNRNYYSFATKYCNWHNQTNYPVYDSFVDDVLWALNKNKCLFKYRHNLKSYSEYGKALKSLVNIYNLQSVMSDNYKYKVNYKILDKYLWLLGKNFFGDPNLPSVKDIKAALKGRVSRTIVGNYVIVRTKNGTIKITHNGVVVSNIKEALRQISNNINFSYDCDWNTRQFGKKLIVSINLNNITL
ncbi:MAG: hypothetical protein IJ352_02775 [Muribaculaceae bacterium]|nr:hypothetical protein [Muribaculaceae bacterium]MBQ7853936.1 hypothetical protein [Muribaculaceae bacterium]